MPKKKTKKTKKTKTKKKTKTYAKEEVRSPWITTGMIEFLHWKGQEFIFLTLEPTCKCKSSRSQRPEGWLKGCGAVQKALEAWKLRCVCVHVCMCVQTHTSDDAYIHIAQVYICGDFCTHRRRKWQPNPVILPIESQGWRSLVGCRLWGRTESDTTEAI